MKKLIALFLLFPVVAIAANQPLTVKQLCQRMADVQTTSSDVEYKPNKDVHGRDVAPADLDSGTPEVKLSDEVTVAIGTDQLRQLNLPTNIPYTPYMNLGNVTVKKDGSVYFNGQRLTQPQRQGLCNDKPDMKAPNTSDKMPPAQQTDQPFNSSGQTPPQSPPVSQ